MNNPLFHRCQLEESVQSRRMSDPGWVRRWKRSLGRNGQHRARLRAGHELHEAMLKLSKESEAEHKQAAQTVMQLARTKSPVGRLALRILGLAMGRRG